MKTKQIAEAYITLSKMGSMQLPLPTAYKLFKLRKQFKDSFEFNAAREQSIIAHNGGVQQDNGTYKFADPETTMHVYREMQELENMEVDIEFEPVEVPLDSISEEELSMNDIAALDGIVIFN